MGREDDRRGGVGDFREFLDENRALGPQAVDDIAVMHDLVADIDRWTIDLQGLFHSIDGTDDAGAEATRRTQQNGEGRLGHGRGSGKQVSTGFQGL